ncbi:MAG: peptidylprolyl isomerase [Betaproteobacteria bacterium RIFCSPLOWO2_02_64_14]|nr:MAG: peptidylprolyl isomerase [Betaproteobacteria bacterium RIFCSPLOWO2_02_64_14]
MTLHRIFPAIALAMLMAATFDSHAQVAKVNGVVIPQAHLDMVVQAQTARGQPDSPEMRDSIKNTLINQEVIAQEALKKGLQKNPAVAAQIALQRQEILVNAFVQDYLKAHPISDDTLKKEYERQRAAAGAKEYKARHILVEKEDEAKEAIAQIRNGAAFEKVAGERSRDQGSKIKGGELEWAVPTNYVKPFAVALVKLKKGQMTEAPVQSNFGWHVIRLDDERPFKAPAFDEVKANLQRGLQQQLVQKAVADLRTKAKIE